MWTPDLLGPAVPPLEPHSVITSPVIDTWNWVPIVEHDRNGPFPAALSNPSQIRWPAQKQELLEGKW
jgi:hypothetical protein